MTAPLATCDHALAALLVAAVNAGLVIWAAARLVRALTAAVAGIATPPQRRGHHDRP